MCEEMKQEAAGGAKIRRTKTSLHIRLGLIEHDALELCRFARSSKQRTRKPQVTLSLLENRRLSDDLFGDF